MHSVVIFGPPGSGKGTQCTKIKEKFNYEHISTGDLLREEIKGQTKLGMDAKGFMDRGELVPDSVIMGMIDEKVKTLQGKGVLFDGIPRTVAQSEELDRILRGHNRQVNAVICLNVEESELIRRLLERGKVSGRSDDLQESTIRTRLSEYHSKTKSVADFYSNSDRRVCEVDGQQSIDSVGGAISEILTGL